MLVIDNTPLTIFYDQKKSPGQRRTQSHRQVAHLVARVKSCLQVRVLGLQFRVINSKPQGLTALAEGSVS